MSEHEPPTPQSRGSRYGLAMFFAYLLLYGGFVLLNAFAPAFMETLLPGGVNLAIGYGIGLIAAAVVLSLLYAWLCRAGASAHDPEARS